MIRMILILFLFINGVASAEKPAGFLWYNMEHAKKKVPKVKPKGISFNQLSFTERDAVLRFYTMEALHKARYTKKVEDMRHLFKSSRLLA